MKCPFCSYHDHRVLDTRMQKENTLIRRRRECFQCKGRFTTQETVIQHYPFIQKKDDRREPFDKEKISRGIQAACHKRSISLSTMETIVERVSKKLLDLGEKEVPSSWIGQQVMLELKKLDDVAYVRFASVYRTFRDVQEFLETLGENTLPLSKTPTPLSME